MLQFVLKTVCDLHGSFGPLVMVMDRNDRVLRCKGVDRDVVQAVTLGVRNSSQDAMSSPVSCRAANFLPSIIDSCSIETQSVH